MNSIKECIDKINNIHRKFDQEGCFDCPFFLDCGNGDCYVDDIFCYLIYSQEYIERTNYIGKANYTTKNLYYNAINELNAIKDEDWKDRNFSLTWEELKQMKGQPVWLVVDGKERWSIIREVTNEHLILESGLPLHKSWMNHPDGWQAYRKERENEDVR